MDLLSLSISILLTGAGGIMFKILSEKVFHNISVLMIVIGLLGTIISGGFVIQNKFFKKEQYSVPEQL